MKYNGIELKEFTSEKPIAFDPPKRMLVWDNTYDGPIETDVLAYLPRLMYPAITEATKYAYCAAIPETPKSRRATYRELSQWLAEGNGELGCHSDLVKTSVAYNSINTNEKCSPEFKIRKWDDKEWHQPTADYMGLED